MSSNESEEGSSERLTNWLSCRGHPEPDYKLTSWDDKIQAKITLMQSRPFSTSGKFDGTPFMSKPLQTEQQARDSVALKSLRMLYRLAERFPDQHAIKFPDRVKNKKDDNNQNEGDVKRLKEDVENNTNTNTNNNDTSISPTVAVDLDDID